MYTDIKTFEDACKIQNLDPLTVIPDFSLFPEGDREAMIAHSKLVIIAKTINGDWLPNWENYGQYKYHPYFEMSPFSFDHYDGWSARSTVGSRLCFESREKAKYAGKQFEELYKTYFTN